MVSIKIYSAQVFLPARSHSGLYVAFHTQPGGDQRFSALLCVHMPINGCLFGFFLHAEICENDRPEFTQFMLVLIPKVAF